MRLLFCSCGEPVFYDNIACLNCSRVLAFDPMLPGMLGLREGGDGVFVADDGQAYRLCANRLNYQVCNGFVVLVDGVSESTLCNTCQLNRTIPIVDRPENLVRWQRLERAKRRLVAGLAVLGLQVGRGNGNNAGPMRFDFIEDKRSHPDVLEHFVSTGHKDGLITINLMEADEVQRVRQRELSGERYRTLLGHFRHEAGHYFYLQVINDWSRFKQLFGDPSADYDQALNLYYDRGPVFDWQGGFISAYASSHPLEDWAECFAHLLHMQDTLETAATRGLIDLDVMTAGLPQQLEVWRQLTVSLNEVNRSLGTGDPYPFVINTVVADKLQFVREAIATANAPH